MTDWLPEKLLAELERSLGITIEKPHVFVAAMTHSSFANENALPISAHYERLEFLGDAVLELVVSERLLEAFPDRREGDLSKCRSALVNEKVLSSLGQRLSLGDHLRFGRGEARERGSKKASILADAVESLCAALFLSNGLEAVRAFVDLHLGKEILETAERVGHDDSKSQLQEYTQKLYKAVPQYKVVKEEGPDHRKMFLTEVWIQEKKWGKASGRSKKESEQNAARITLEKLQRNPEEI